MAIFTLKKNNEKQAIQGHDSQFAVVGPHPRLQSLKRDGYAMQIACYIPAGSTVASRVLLSRLKSHGAAT
jgi:hypothetical protein